MATALANVRQLSDPLSGSRAGHHRSECIDGVAWIHFGNKGGLRIVVEGDKRPFNQYGAMLVNPIKHPNVKSVLGQRFIDYLVSPEGQRDIGRYQIDGQQLFHLTPLHERQSRRAMRYTKIVTG